jgi:type I restriction enzyme S subunit
LSLEDARKIWIAIPKADVQANIEADVREAARLRDEASRNQNDATRLLESELGLDKLKFERPVGYTARLSDVLKGGRSDAEFFDVKYESRLETIKGYRRGSCPLRCLARQKYPNFDRRKQAGEFDYIEIGDIDVSNGNCEKHRMSPNHLPANATIRLTGGELLVSKVRPTRGAIAIFEDEPVDRTVCSGAFFVCTVNDPRRREIVWLYLRSMKALFEKYCGGTSYPTIDSRHIADFPVPLFDDCLADRVGNLVMEAKRALLESKALLAQAKARVEQLIEEATR